MPPPHDSPVQPSGSGGQVSGLSFGPPQVSGGPPELVEDCGGVPWVPELPVDDVEEDVEPELLLVEDCGGIPDVPEVPLELELELELLELDDDELELDVSQVPP